MELLGPGVDGGSGREPGSEPVEPFGDRDPEIGEIGATGFVEQDVRRLDVTVDHTGGVGRHQCPSDFVDQLGDAIEGPGSVDHE